MFWCLNVCIHLTCACGKYVTSSKSTRLAYSLTSHVSSLCLPACFFAGAFFATRKGSMVVPRTASKTSLNSRPDALKLPNLLNQKQIPRSFGQISMKCGLTQLQLTTKTLFALHQTPRLNEGSSQSSIPCCLRPSIPIQRWDGSQRDQPSDVQRSAHFSNTKNTQLRTSRNLLYPPAIHAIHAIYGLCPTVLFQVALVTQ